MTTLEIIKMLVEQAIKEEDGSCENCVSVSLEPDQYPCRKCKRNCLDYYKEDPKKEN